MNVVSYLNHAEIFILPTLSKGEGSPVALLEAIANGKVVIGSNVPGISDQLEDFPLHLFKPNEQGELAEKLIFFMNKSKLELSEIGMQCKERVLENYTIEKEVLRHEEFYKSFF
jgi:glycosyltransferase involved in cell wall biosynthesis